MKKGKPRETARIYYGDNFDLYWTVAVRDAARDVVINGSLMDALTGTPGATIGCHLSNCAMKNQNVFPHPVFLASFTKSAALIVTKIAKGKPSEAVRYHHSYGRLVDLNDKDKSRQIIKQHPELADRRFVLRKPEKRNHVPGTHQRVSNVPTVKRSALLRGALDRAVNAGLIDRGLAASLRKKSK